MTEHVLECRWESQRCICEELRACEQRVREAENRNVIGSVSLAAIGEANVQQYHRGYAAGLDAAVEALEKYRPNYFASIRQAGPARVFLGRDEAQAAIRALKEK